MVPIFIVTAHSVSASHQPILKVQSTLHMCRVIILDRNRNEKTHRPY